MHNIYLSPSWINCGRVQGGGRLWNITSKKWNTTLWCIHWLTRRGCAGALYDFETVGHFWACLMVQQHVCFICWATHLSSTWLVKSMLAFVNLLNSWQVHLSTQVVSCQVQNNFWLVNTVNFGMYFDCSCFSIFQYHLKYTSLHLNLNCSKNYRCKNPHLATKESPFTVSRKKQNYACQLRWRLGNWVCQLTKFLRAMCLGAFFPAPKLLQVAKERLSWFCAFSAQLNTISDYFQWRFHCLKSMRLCLVSGDSFRGTFGRTGESL